MGEDQKSAEPAMYTEEQVSAMIREAQVRQLRADETRTYGNMFYAESLDHVEGLAKRDRAWEKVAAYGRAFRSRFEEETGQVRSQAPAGQAPAQPEKAAPKEGTPPDEDGQQ